MFKVTLFVQHGICFNCITKRLSNTSCYILKWVMTWPNPTKSPAPTLKCWTQLAYTISIRLKQALSYQNTTIWSLFNLLKVKIRICIHITILTQTLLSLKFYWKLNIKMKKMRLHTFISLLMTYRFCAMYLIPKNSFMFNFSNTDAHICLTEYVLSICCLKCIICDVT